MKQVDSDEEEEEQSVAKHKELRKSANQSIQQLSSTVKQVNAADHNDYDDDDAAADDEEEAKGSGGTFFTAVAEEGRAPWSQKTQSEAVNQLKSLLLKQHIEIPTCLSPSEKPSPSKKEQMEGRSSVPVLQSLVPMIHGQSDYIQHLEAEVKFCKEELQVVKQRIRVVVVENEKLQSELKSRAMDYTIHNSAVDNRSHHIPQRSEHNTWKNELEQLKVIHQAQIDSFQAQVISLRKDLSVSQRECEEMNVRLKHAENQAADALKAGGAPRVAGLCLKCAQHEAVLAETHANLHVQAIDRLTKERDELMAALRAAQASQQETQQKEWSACLQVKQAVEMAEEANLQRNTVEVQCEQLRREVVRQREQLEREAQALKARLTEAREKGRGEGRKQKEELAQTVSNLSQRVAELEGHLDRGHRERGSLTTQLEDTLNKLTSQEQQNAKVCMELRFQLSQAKLKKEEAERDLREINAKASRQMEKAAQEVERLNSELVGCRRHLEAVQKDGSQSQAEALSLAEQLANAQRQLHLTRQDRDNAARAHVEEMSSVTASTQEREKNLCMMLQKTEAELLQRVGEADSIMSSQNSLIRKLKEECSKLVVKMEDLSQNSRSELQQLALEKQHLEETVRSLRTRCSDLEEQCVQHGRVHQRMKDRLQQLDRHCQSSAQQVCELLAKQNQLMQERNTLCEELQSLRVTPPERARVETLSA
uniref:Serologically defined colon cancer antigen 8 n=1 Tax=Nothobranchius kuhntae TaxID=321403 RepID=A0A1A8JHK4_NOTKU